MLDVIIAVREPGRLKPDWSSRFLLPEIPEIGSYITINRPGESAPWGEDMVVKKVWWMLFNPNGNSTENSPDHVGTVKQIIVLCEAALGPFSTKSWRNAHEGRTGVQTFEVARFAWEQERDSGVQSQLAKKLMHWPDAPKRGKPGPKGGGKE